MPTHLHQALTKNNARLSFFKLVIIRIYFLSVSRVRLHASGLLSSILIS